MKDRLAELRQISGFIEEEDCLTYTRSNLTTDKSPLFKFLETAGQIREDIHRITRQTTKIKALQSDILSSPVLEQKTNRELEKVTGEIKKTIMNVKKDLTQVQADIEAPDNDHDPEYTIIFRQIKKTQYTTMYQTFRESASEYQKAQTSFDQAQEERLRRLTTIASNGVSETRNRENLGTSCPSQVFNLFSDIRHDKASLNAAEERKKELTKLEDSIRKMSELFKEMEMMVEEQGHTLDRIENYVQETEDRVAFAASQLNMAVRYR